MKAQPNRFVFRLCSFGKEKFHSSESYEESMDKHFQLAADQSDECPQAFRLQNWLDETLELEAWEIAHISRCHSCARVLEQYSDNPRLKEMSGRQATGATGDFAQEPELKEIQQRVRAPKLARERLASEEPTVAQDDSDGQ